MFNRITKGVGDVLEFPPDVTGEGPRITMMGREQVIVESYQSILHFGEDEIRVETAVGVLCITGRQLVLGVILPTELKISGIVAGISFEGGAKHD